ncbi:MAG: RagB/SusD family nutrient uptake outer membrane protein [Prolixibacteraceae bacterium]|nr:RagB/SusD family nutrient uptake outer membrane protein [Prolixibacteraceae bacterium]
MKRLNIILIMLALIGGFTACNDELDVINPNNQTTYDFGDSESELQEAVIACYTPLRWDGSFSRVGYTLDAVRGDEVWNSSQQWYLEYDNLNSPGTIGIGDEWIWRSFYIAVNHTNFVLSKVDGVTMSDDSYKQIKGQALFLRALAYYELVTYYQTVPLITDYASYSDINTMYASNEPEEEGISQQDLVLDQIEADLTEAMQILPSRDAGGEWAQGRATCGAAAGYLARALMFRHKFTEAYTVLKDIIAGVYGHYELTADYGDNFKEDTENNKESLFEVQFMNFGTGGTADEWVIELLTPEATQGHAVESNYASQELGSWGDLAGSPWLYNLFKKEKCTDGRLDPRLYWTLVSYEDEYNSYTGQKTAAYPGGDPRSNTVYQTDISATPLSNNAQGGISIAKFTNARNNLYSSITNGLHCGVNLRLMRYSDVLLRAAECENEINGPTAAAIEYINIVRRRAALEDLQASNFPSADALFEQIANVERPKEFGCENGRGIDLLRWGFFYDDGRFNQLLEHGYYKLDGTASTEELTAETASASSFQYYYKGHEYFPIFQSTLNANPNLVGNSANKNEDNGPAFLEKWTVRPVVELD